MRTLEAISVKCAIMFMFGLSVFLVNEISCAEEGKYPIKVEIIDKAQARYDTPENAYAAMFSSLIKKDIEWYYETFTKESAAQNKKEYQEAGIDPRKKFDTVTGLKDIFIVDKIKYKSGVFLIVKSYEQNGTIMQVPSPFVKEGSKWKLTNAFSADEELHEYLDYIKPEEILSSTIKIYPKRWSLSWYNWIKEHMDDQWVKYFADKISILCLITNLKDNQGKPYSVEEIVPETLLLNHLLSPQPWRFNREEEIALIINSKEDRYPGKRKNFKDNYTNKLLNKYQCPVMLVRFNKFKAMETLPEMIPGKKCDITISGELKDGKRFTGTTRIKIISWNFWYRWKARYWWRWNQHDWMNSEKDKDNWWNKEKDFDDRWEKTIKKHKQKTGRKR